jgi:phosphomevalonate kinase
MKACAPGKLVLSGAYSVLVGAPAIVSAVDRYVCCDSERPATLETPEVRAALPQGPVPHFDATALRADGRKLGLGSSAAILLASLAAADPRSFDSDQALRVALAAAALVAHRQAQGGGSGIDVAASTWGGTLIAMRGPDGELELEPCELPSELVVEAWSSPVAASTPELLAGVARLGARAPGQHAQLFAELTAAARRAASALRRGQTLDLIAELQQQGAGLAALGAAAGVPIVTPEAKQLAALAAAEGAAVLPSGAGGGDIVLWASSCASPAGFRDLATMLGHHQLHLSLHARGVHRCSPEGTPARGT